MKMAKNQQFEAIYKVSKELHNPNTLKAKMEEHVKDLYDNVDSSDSSEHSVSVVKTMKTTEVTETSSLSNEVDE